MIWTRMLAYITGTVDQELLLRNEYLVADVVTLGFAFSWRESVTERLQLDKRRESQVQ